MPPIVSTAPVCLVPSTEGVPLMVAVGVTWTIIGGSVGAGIVLIAPVMLVAVTVIVLKPGVRPARFILQSPAAWATPPTTPPTVPPTIAAAVGRVTLVVVLITSTATVAVSSTVPLSGRIIRLVGVVTGFSVKVTRGTGTGPPPVASREVRRSVPPASTPLGIVSSG